MPVFEGSRYEGAVVKRVRAADGITRPAVYQSIYWLQDESVEFSLYTTREGDRLDRLAYKLYGSSELWWVIARINPELLYPENIAANTAIRIPTS